MGRENRASCLSHRREEAFVDQLLPELNPNIVIDVQQGDSNPADRRAAEKISTLPAEMRFSLVAAGVEQREEFAGLPVQACNVRTLKRIAAITA